METVVAVLGADGRSGQECVTALLNAGYMVRAGVHSGSLEPRAGLTQQECNVMNKSDIQALLQGASIVVSLIGHGKGSPVNLQVTAIRNCIEALQDQPDSRLISLTGTGVRFPGDKPSLIDHILNISIKLIDRNRIIDGIEHAKVMQQGPVNWTLVRVLKLTNGKHHGTPHLTTGGPAELFTPRARVAAAIVEIIRTNTFHRQAPVVSRSK